MNERLSLDNLGKNKLRGDVVDGIFVNESIITKLYGKAAKIDLSKPPSERLEHFVEKVSMPNRIIFGDYEIELAWSDTERTIQGSIQELIDHV